MPQLLAVTKGSPYSPNTEAQGHTHPRSHIHTRTHILKLTHTALTYSPLIAHSHSLKRNSLPDTHTRFLTHSLADTHTHSRTITLTSTLPHALSDTHAQSRTRSLTHNPPHHLHPPSPSLAPTTRSHSPTHTPPLTCLPCPYADLSRWRLDRNIATPRCPVSRPSTIGCSPKSDTRISQG